MHGDVVLAGPLWWFASALFVGAILLALFMAIDALRPVRAERFAELPESRWLYVIISGFYAVAATTTQLVRIAPVAIGASLAAPLIIALGLVYLLRVVFPKRAAEE